MIKAVFIDFDGTLYSHHKNGVPDSTVVAINELRKNNIKVFLCTGRSSVELLTFDIKNIQFDGKILTNGQIVYDEKDQIVFENPIDGKLKDILINIYNNKICPITFVTKNDIILDYVDDYITNILNSINTEIPHVEEYKGQPFYMCTAFTQNMSALQQFHIKEYGETTSWSPGVVDIYSKNISKLTGIKKMIEYLGISLDETMAIGDGENDIPMISECGIGICMGNGTDEVKAISDYVTSDIDDNGIYNACRHYGLIK